MISAVIFDMDGTLLNTLEDIKESTNFALSSLGFPNCSIEEIKNFVGDGVKLLFERAIPVKHDENSLNECIKIFKKHYSENMYKNTKPYPNIIESLNELKKLNIKIGVVSNKFDNAVKELSKKYFNNLIDISVGQSDNIPQKPSPNGVFKALRYLNTNNAVYVGDSDVDVKTAKNSQLPCIGVTWGYRDIKFLKGADYIINSPIELLEIVRKM